MRKRNHPLKSRGKSKTKRGKVNYSFKAIPEMGPALRAVAFAKETTPSKYISDLLESQPEIKKHLKVK